MTLKALTDALQAARDPNRMFSGRAKLTLTELRNAATGARKAEGEKPAGKFTAQEAALINAINVNECYDSRARAYLTTLKAEVAANLYTTPTGNVITLQPGHAQLPVFINAQGWAVPSASITGQPPLTDMLKGVYGLEEAIRRQLRISRDSLGNLLDMDMGVKKKMIDTLISTADMRKNVSANGTLPGLSKEDTMELRSSAFTSLLSMVAVLDRGNTAGAQQIDRIHGKLVEMAKDEPDRWLGLHMARMLNHPVYVSKLDPSERTTVEGKPASIDGVEVFESKVRKKFDVKNIMDANGYVQWEHVCGEGEGFFESYKYTMQNQDIHGAKFKVVPGSETWNSYQLQVTFNPPRTVDGKEVKGITMHVRRFDGDMFDAVGKNYGTASQPVYRGFSYGGHSQIGENQEVSLKKALAEGKFAKTPQIAVLDLCSGLDNLDDDMRAFGPNLDVMTTHDSSYFNKGQVKDATGKVVVQDGVTRSEGQDILVELLKGLTAGEDYKQINTRFKNKIPSWNHEEPPNTHTPTFTNWSNVLSFHMDSDGDGVMDARDIHFHCALKSVQPDLDQEFVLKALPNNLRPDQIKGSAAKNAVLDMNVATHYNALTHSNDPILHKFVADGFFDGSDTKQLIRFNYEEIYTGRKGITVQYNSRLAHTTREALEALTMYCSMLEMADRTDRGQQPNVSFTGPDKEIDRKLMALAFAVFRLNYDGEGSMNDQRIWKQLLQVLKLPASLDYETLRGFVDAEHHDYSGNMAVVNQFKATLSPAVKTELAKTSVGRPDGWPALGGTVPPNA